MDFETEHTPLHSLESRSKARELIQPRESLRKNLNGILRSFSPAERLFLYLLSIIMGVTAFILLANVNMLVSTEVPTQGGSLVEGGAGTPRFINPLLSVSNPDQDLTMLIYSGLLRPEHTERAEGGGAVSGNYIPDLAESYEISDDGTIYTFHLRKNLTFHDGVPLTANDVLFTISLAQNPEIKSPRRADWEGVAVTAPDAATVVFTLPHAYAPFRENLTIGIVPKHLWENIPPEEFPFGSLNTHPIGSGPYRVREALFDTTGAPTEYRLNAFKGFALGEPNISTLTYRVFANEEELLLAYESGDIESFVASTPKNVPREILEGPDVQRAALARVFGIFLNQNHAPILSNAAARDALDAAIDKEDIIQKVLGGFGTPLTGPVPPGLLPSSPVQLATTTASTSTTLQSPVEKAQMILTRGGWVFDTSESVWKKDKASLSITLATADTEELVATAEVVAEAWRAVGIPTSVQVYPLQEFNTTILRPRAYDAVLFGEVVGRSLDLFAFWHSSQRNDPGLNLSLYTSTQADKILATARAETSIEKRSELLREFLNILDEDVPAVFLYAPQLAYVVPSHVRGAQIGTLTSPADRFISIHSWYRDTERVWNIFSK